MGALSVVCSNTLSFNPNKGEKNEKGALRATFIQDEDEEEKQLQRHIFFSLRRHLKSFHFCRQVRPLVILCAILTFLTFPIRGAFSDFFFFLSFTFFPPLVGTSPDEADIRGAFSDFFLSFTFFPSLVGTSPNEADNLPGASGVGSLGSLF